MEQQQATAPRPDGPRPGSGGVPAAFVGVDQAEAALVEHYPRLTRLAYLVLPPTLGRNRRVLTAHSVVQRALPRKGVPAQPHALPSQRRPGRPVTDPGYALVRLRVLRASLVAEHPRVRLPFVRREVPVPPMSPLLPQVWGLRLFPRSGGMDELTLHRALSALPAAARAAYVLRALEGLGDTDVRAVLEAAGAEDVRGALAAASGAAPAAGGRDRALLESAEFDPCSLQARPTDLLRRRRHARTALAGAAALVCGALLTVPGGGRGPDGAAAPPYTENAAAQAALDPAQVTRAAAGTWRNATRRGLSAWPARGDRTHDRALLRRALAVWARPGPDVQVSATPGTAKGPAAGPPQLLYAGVADRAAVVLLYDGLRVVRYAEPADGSDGTGGAVLDLARTDGADDSSATALVLSRTDSNVRYLTAPWTGRTELTDLLEPTGAARPLPIGEDGTTGPVPSPARATTCTAWQALRMDGHLFTDLGELLPARLTSGSPDRPGDPDGPDGGPQARTAWARTACHLGGLRGQGVRTVNSWTFAQQRLPAGGGTATWVCTRAETWRGAGSRTFAQVQTPPTGGQGYAPGTVVARSEGGPGCGPREPWALAGVVWKAPGGQWWLVAAGSGQLTEVSASGGTTGRAAGPQLAVPAAAGARAELSGRLRSGERVRGLR
ncbi:hypothetical protein [Streptomyces sp. Ac-502]|uniref:hypothetical protein n=1 Tax=Streptomyces sp. Ac-502 TaxID=3342801 RepID=UPI00386276E4